MIGRLRGNILEKQPPLILLEVYGISYEVHMPMTCFYQLPELRQEAIVFTHLVIRADTKLMYGFNNQEERSLFRELLKVNGVGPKLALLILSRISAQQLVNAVESEEITDLLKLPGVGKKTAQRLMVEMKGRFKKFNGDLLINRRENFFSKEIAKISDNENEANAVSALIALGYKPQEANHMIRKIAKSESDCETLIRDALRVSL